MRWAHAAGPDGVQMADLQCAVARDVFRWPLCKGLEDRRGWDKRRNKWERPQHRDGAEIGVQVIQFAHRLAI